MALKIIRERYGDVWSTVAGHLHTLFKFKPLHSSSAKELGRLPEIWLYVENVVLVKPRTAFRLDRFGVSRNNQVGF